MNLSVQAACGHWVKPIGTDGSKARARQHAQACAACKSSLPTTFAVTISMICPHCGESQSDPDSAFGNREAVDTDCGHCGKPFLAHRIVFTRYSTEVQP